LGKKLAMSLTQKKWAMLFSAVLFTLSGYLFINHWLETHGVFHSMEITWDRKIPYVSFFAVFYAFVYIEPVFTLLVLWKDYALIKVAFKAFLANAIICQMFHLFFPVQFELRQSLVPPYSVFDHIVRFFYWIDGPANCFPSLHVAATFICARVIYLHHRSWYPYFLTVAWLITLSTLLIRQHYLLDLLGGFAVYFTLRAIFLPKDLKERKGLGVAEPAQLGA
jgi:membrane-associated phospholipid phosphatase